MCDAFTSQACYISVRFRYTGHVFASALRPGVLREVDLCVILTAEVAHVSLCGVSYLSAKIREADHFPSQLPFIPFIGSVNKLIKVLTNTF